MLVPRYNPFISAGLIFGPTVLLCFKTAAAADGKKSETTGQTSHLTAVRDLYTRAATATTTNQVVHILGQSFEMIRGTSRDLCF